MINGLQINRTIKKTERFESFEAQLNEQKVFAKKACSPNTAVHLEFQIKNSQVVNDIGQGIVRAPKIIATDGDWVVTEWISGESIEARLAAEPENVANITAEVINIFDSQPDAQTPIRPIFTSEGLVERVHQRIDPAIRQQAGDLIENSLQKFAYMSASLKPCLQDADVQPEHLFVDSTQRAKYILVDSEHLNTHWPRFYDLANNYSKYWKRDSREFSKQILKSYLAISGHSAEELFKPLSACLIVRALALHWENDYDPGALDTNIPRSQELLKLILQANNLDNLL